MAKMEIRLSDQEKAEWKALAADMGVSASEMVRRAVAALGQTGAHVRTEVGTDTPVVRTVVGTDVGTDGTEKGSTERSITPVSLPQVDEVDEMSVPDPPLPPRSISTKERPYTECEFHGMMRGTPQEAPCVANGCQGRKRTLWSKVALA